MLKTAPTPLETHSAFCGLPFTKMIVDAAGDVAMCCYQKQHLGNIKSTDPLEVWNSPLAREVRQATDAGNLHRLCTSWNTCPYLIQERATTPFLRHRDARRPLYLEICLPETHCNIGGENPSDQNPACIMCIRNYDVQRLPDLTDVICEKCRPLMPHLRFLSVLGVAEPFWQDAVFGIFQKMDFARYKKNITFTTNTNVLCLTEKVVDRFFAEVYWSSLSFSIDAASPTTFHKIRRLDAYDKVLENIRNYLKARQNHGGRDRHWAEIYNNINLLNVDEMAKMVEAAADLGVDRLLMLPTHDQVGRVKMDEFLLNARNVPIFKKAAAEARKRAEQLGVNLFFPKPFDVPPPRELLQLGVKRISPEKSASRR